LARAADVDVIGYRSGAPGAGGISYTTAATGCEQRLHCFCGAVHRRMNQTTIQIRLLIRQKFFRLCVSHRIFFLSALRATGPHIAPHTGLGCAGNWLIESFGGAGLTCSQHVMAQSTMIEPASSKRSGWGLSALILS
jgi:hypothetical protein